MSKLIWDDAGDKVFETGVSKGVLYLPEEGEYTNGEAWNGLTAVTESPSGAEPTALWANNRKYGELMSTEEFGGTIEAYTYPDGWRACNGEVALVPGVFITQQSRSTFGLSYRTELGNDTEDLNYGYKLHLVYGARVKPAEKARNTINDSPEAATFSWEFSTTPVDVPNYKPCAHIEIDSTTVDAGKLAALEEILYGTESEAARLPLPTELATLMQAAG